MAKVRIVVIEDSVTVRHYLLRILQSDPDFEVVGAGDNGQDAIDLCRTLRPDVITLDLHMPLLDGLAATEQIMGHFPTPILIVSSSTNRGDLFKTYDALAAGAVDILEKPTGEEDDEAWAAQFRFTLKLVSRIKVITHPRARLAAMTPVADTTAAPSHTMGRSRTTAGAPISVPHSLVAIGASTGGPGALVEVVKEIPERLPVTVLVVLHLGEPFGAAFTQWLARQTGRSVCYAGEGDALTIAAPGRVLVAPPGKHLVARGTRLHLTSSTPRHSCRPSIDVLFDSLAEVGSAPRTIGCLLTGMGRDGASGLLALRQAGALTFAQDEGSSVVYGMPREAALLDAAERILPLRAIGPAIARSLGAVPS